MGKPIEVRHTSSTTVVVELVDHEDYEHRVELRIYGSPGREWSADMAMSLRVDGLTPLGCAHQLRERLRQAADLIEQRYPELEPLGREAE